LGLSVKEWYVPTKKEKDTHIVLEALECMEQVVLCGFLELSQDAKLLFLEHVMSKNNHTRLVKRKKKETASEEDSKPAAAKVVCVPPSSIATSHQAVATVKQGFIVPKPGVNGGVRGALNDKCCVLSGVFPKIGGGAGLSQGKDHVKAMIQGF
jgi:hypothetical protein